MESSIFPMGGRDESELAMAKFTRHGVVLVFHDGTTMLVNEQKEGDIFDLIDRCPWVSVSV